MTHLNQQESATLSEGLAQLVRLLEYMRKINTRYGDQGLAIAADDLENARRMLAARIPLLTPSGDKPVGRDGSTDGELSDSMGDANRAVIQ